MKQTRAIISYTCLLLITAMAFSCKSSSQKPRRPEMKMTLSMNDKKPLGGHAAYRLISNAFSDMYVKENSMPFREFFREFTGGDITRNKSIFTVISTEFYPTEDEVDAMTDYVAQGNTLFVASDHFSQHFLDKFKLRSVEPPPYEMLMELGMTDTKVRMTDSTKFKGSAYGCFYHPFGSAIDRNEDYPRMVIAKGHGNNPTAVAFRYGSGRLIVACNVATFTNYFLLTGNNHQYILDLLSYLPKDAEQFNYDLYYNKVDEVRKNNNNDSAFQELMKRPALRWAFWLFLIGALLLIIMALIRRQRVIPIIKPNTNSSIEFVETVARLYLLKKDNKNIAQKMINFFMDHVRNKYYLSSTLLNTELATILSAKSGVPLDKTLLLFKTIADMQDATTVTDMQLLDLNEQLQHFFK